MLKLCVRIAKVKISEIDRATQIDKRQSTIVLITPRIIFWINSFDLSKGTNNIIKILKKYYVGLANELNISMKVFYISSSCQYVEYDTDKDRKICLIIPLSTCFICS